MKVTTVPSFLSGMPARQLHEATIPARRASNAIRLITPICARICTQSHGDSFHVVGLDQRGAIVLRQKWFTRPGGITVCQHAALPHRDGGLRRGTSS